MKNRKNILTYESGFTLIELLVILAIIGILATIVLLNLWGITDRASRSAAASNMRSLLTEIEANDEGRQGDYPSEGELEEFDGYEKIDEMAEEIEYEDNVSEGEYKGGYALSAKFDFGERGEEYIIISSARGFEDEMEGHFNDQQGND